MEIVVDETQYTGDALNKRVEGMLLVKQLHMHEWTKLLLLDYDDNTFDINEFCATEDWLITHTKLEIESYHVTVSKSGIGHHVYAVLVSPVHMSVVPRLQFLFESDPVRARLDRKRIQSFDTGSKDSPYGDYRSALIETPREAQGVIDFLKRFPYLENELEVVDDTNTAIKAR